jgi:coenzyme F420 hydrogenase subunit beta
MIEEVMGIPLDQVAKVWYRKGEYPGRFTVETKDGQTHTRSSFEYIWPIIHYKRDRCLVCFDYTAELSDISVGDYFYPEMKRGVPGLSAVIIRTDIGKQLVEAARDANYIAIPGPAEKDNFYMGGFETKKHGGSFYLDTRRRRGWPTPNNQLPLHTSPMPRKVERNHPLLTPDTSE